MRHDITRTLIDLVLVRLLKGGESGVCDVLSLGGGADEADGEDGEEDQRGPREGGSHVETVEEASISSSSILSHPMKCMKI